MKKFNWNKFLNITLLIATIFIIGGLLGQGFKKPVSQVSAQLVEGVTFKAGVVKRTATSLSLTQNKYNYESDSIYNGELDNINNNDEIMLYNYNAATQLTSGTLARVENIYLGFGLYEDTVRLVALTVTAKLNGSEISVKETQTQTASGLPSNHTHVSYWYDYFDGRNYGEGLYEFQFDYAYAVGSNVYTGQTYKYSFYLLDQTKYDNYPIFANTEIGALDSTSTKQYFYNYTIENLPTLNFDASRYNIAFTKEKNSVIESYTSKFTLASDNTGTLTISKTVKGVTTTHSTISNITKDNDNLGYGVQLEFDNLGTYTFTIKYIIQTSETVFKTSNILAYDVTEPGYEEGTIQKGSAHLHIFGIKAYFTSDTGNRELKQRDSNGDVILQADVTSLLIDKDVDIAFGFNSDEQLKEINYPITNLAPISFDYNAIFKMDGIIPLSEYRLYQNKTSTTSAPGYITKDSKLDSPGFYEVIVYYTFERYHVGANKGSYLHKQVFMFQIDKSAPEVNLYKGAEQTINNKIKNEGFVNTGVSASWPTTGYFQAPIRATYFQYDFNGALITSENYTQSSLMGDGSNGSGKYVLRVYYEYSNIPFVEYTFTIDTQPISNVDIKPIYAQLSIEDNTQITGYGLVTDNNQVNFNNSALINHPFTLIYSPKASGAKITTKYYKIPFSNNANAGATQEYSDSKILVENNFVIDSKNMVNPIEYNLNYESITSGIVSGDNAFIESKSYIYIFEITDTAGNSNQAYVIYDLTTPNVVVDADVNTAGIQPIENAYGIVSKQASVTWGDFKGVKVNDTLGNYDGENRISNKKLSDVIKAESSLFQRINDYYYMCVPITSVQFTQNQNSLTYTANTETFHNSIVIYPKRTSAPVNAINPDFFSGDDKTYNYTVIDSSNIVSATNLAKSNVTRSFVRMFLDNAQGILYGNFESGNNLGEALSSNSTSSAKQLRFTYLPGEADYKVKSVSYTYYPFDPDSYDTINTLISGENYKYQNLIADNTENNIPYPCYPFSKTPVETNKALNLGTIKVPGETSRVVTEVINSEGGSTAYTKPGMYVIKREYDTTGSTEFGDDIAIRYYVCYVDRDGIINIKSQLDDANIYQETRNPMLYQTGSGIIFNFSNPNQGVYDTYFTALQIQQYLASEKNTIFSSNKLPINLYLPLDKYNSKTALLQSTDNTSNTSYINSTSTLNKGNFNLRYVIKFRSSNTVITVIDTTTTPSVINKTYVTVAEKNGFNSLQLIRDGTYSITLYDNSDNRLSQLSSKTQKNINSQYNNSYSFEFVISHESPDGEYYTKYNDDNRSYMSLIRKYTSKNQTTGVSESVYKSLNNNSLRFTFSTLDDKYRAEIDEAAITVQKKVGNNTTTIYGGSAGRPAGVLVFKPDGIDETGEETHSGVYTLTIFDEYDFQRDKKAYIGGSGNNRDYILSASQNIEYIITLQYIGNESDYQVDVNGVVENFFKRTFKITLDNIKPQYNYQTLVNSDNQKYAASQNININMDNYFFAVDDNFVFMQNTSLGGVLDSERVYIRKLDVNQNTLFPDYYKTFTPDDDNFYADGYTNNIRFSESNFTPGDYNIEGRLPATSLFASGSGYYEIVERDEAGNYKVYAVFYNDNDDIVNKKQNKRIVYDYTPALGSSNVKTEEITNSNLPQSGKYNILGNNLTFKSISSSDYFYRCIISYGSTTKSLYNNPNDRANASSFDDFIKLINQELEFTKTTVPAGYLVTITFVNRMPGFDNFVIEYRVPGERLEPIFQDISSSEFKITIPNDNNSTGIIEFHAWKLVNETWVEQTQDSRGKTIARFNPYGASLQGNFYIFGSGEFKFQLIDVFGRGENMDIYPPYYKGMGVGDFREIAYGVNVVSEGVTYTAQTASLKYQTNLYILKIEYLNSDSNQFETITPQNYSAYGIIEQGISENGVRTLRFDNRKNNTIARFKVTLVVEKAGAEYIYNFAINKYLPEIVLRNLSGGKIATSNTVQDPSIHTENFYITWETDIFGTFVDLKRTYIDASGRNQTEQINNIANGYEVGLAGTYEAIISNKLGYVSADKNIHFKLVSGEIVVYDVVLIDGGRETILHPSTTTSTLEVDGLNKILYRYYALTSYDNPQGSNKYIEIRTNKNRGIDYKLISEADPEEETLISKRIYKFYSTSNFGYERYIEIIFVDEVTNFNDLSFSNLAATYPTGEAGVTGHLVLTNGEVTTNVSRINLKWNAYFAGEDDLQELKGNLISLDYYYNGNFIKTIYSNTQEINTFSISTAGIHRFKLYDLAGNVQYFGGSSELVINLVNSVLFVINNSQPIHNQVFNSDVILEITNRYLYFQDPVVTAKLNGQDIEVERIGTSFNQYKFSKQGFYEVTISTKISQTESVNTKHDFTILNPNIALPSFSMPQNSNFKVVSVLKQNADITHTLPNLSELWISPGTLGSGNYTVTLSRYNSELSQDITFSFKVWINNEVPYILSSIPFGTSTTKKITITYNPKIIYDQIGESYIKISGEESILINADSPNEIKNRTLSKNRTYWVQIYSADNKLITSYKLTKDEPLNTTSIIIIIISSIVVIALIVVFVIMRRHLKFR